VVSDLSGRSDAGRVTLLREGADMPARTGHAETPARALWFTAARHAELLEQSVAPPGPGQVSVRAIVSLVSAGTEMLIYRGEGAGELGLETCEGSFAFPVKYAYQVVGEVVATGEGTSFAVGDIVFARHPHQTYFTMNSETGLLVKIPDGMPPDRAVFLNLLSVALTTQLDVPVRFGDRVVVYGQGIVGSLAAQLARRTAGKLFVVDPIASRRERALGWGADLALPPEAAHEAILEATAGRGVDIAIEASGTAPALQAAINVTGQEGTIVVVSFFGTKVVPLVLAPEFHYGRQRIISSQVSSLGSGLQPRWTPARRDATSARLLGEDWLETPVTHRLPFSQAPEAYRLLDTQPDQAMSVVLGYAG
jgi:2-desacetyl-2-hydroxyethyl bacteriochlorophyllide A dehydrogenase